MSAVAPVPTAANDPSVIGVFNISLLLLASQQFFCVPAVARIPVVVNFPIL